MVTKIKIRYPNKRLNYSVFGIVACCDDWPWDHHWLPTDGSGTSTCQDCSGNVFTYDTGTSDELHYMIDNNWGFEFGLMEHSFLVYPTELATLGAGHTQMDEFKRVYIDGLTDLYGIPWWIENGGMMAPASATYQTPGTDNVHYTPGSGMISSYETAYGAAIDFLESNCGTNFQGYSFESGWTNAVKWLSQRTRYCVSEKDWSFFTGNTLNGVNELMGTNTDGTDISPMPTPLQRIGLLDELIVEIFSPMMFTTWNVELPTVKSAYPNLPIVFNVDEVCRGMQWNDTTDQENDSPEWADNWWAQWGVGQPGHRCFAERRHALQQINWLSEQYGPFDGMIYNMVSPCAPINVGLPDLTWHLQWCDTLFPHIKAQTAHLQVPIGPSTPQSLDFSILRDQTPMNIYLTFYDYNGLADFSDAVIDWSIVGTTITKSTADNTIFPAHPVYHEYDNYYSSTPGVPQQDLNAPSFIIRLFPSEVWGISGDHTHTLSVTVRDTETLGDAKTLTFRGQLRMFGTKVKPVPTTTLRSIVYDKVTLQRSGGRPWT